MGQPFWCLNCSNAHALQKPPWPHGMSTLSAFLSIQITHNFSLPPAKLSHLFTWSCGLDKTSLIFKSSSLFIFYSEFLHYAVYGLASWKLASDFSSSEESSYTLKVIWADVDLLWYGRPFSIWFHIPPVFCFNLLFDRLKLFVEIFWKTLKLWTWAFLKFWGLWLVTERYLSSRRKIFSGRRSNQIIRALACADIWIEWNAQTRLIFYLFVGSNLQLLLIDIVRKNNCMNSLWWSKLQRETLFSCFAYFKRIHPFNKLSGGFLLHIWKFRIRFCHVSEISESRFALDKSLHLVFFLFNLISDPFWICLKNVFVRNSRKKSLI